MRTHTASRTHTSLQGRQGSGGEELILEAQAAPQAPGQHPRSEQTLCRNPAPLQALRPCGTTPAKVPGSAPDPATSTANTHCWTWEGWGDTVWLAHGDNLHDPIPEK